MKGKIKKCGVFLNYCNNANMIHNEINGIFFYLRKTRGENNKINKSLKALGSFLLMVNLKF